MNQTIKINRTLTHGASYQTCMPLYFLWSFEHENQILDMYDIYATYAYCYKGYIKEFIELNWTIFSDH